jgi:hypothetical protein
MSSEHRALQAGVRGNPLKIIFREKKGARKQDKYFPKNVKQKTLNRCICTGSISGKMEKVRY